MHYLARQWEAEQQVRAWRWHDSFRAKALELVEQLPAPVGVQLMAGWDARWDPEKAGLSLHWVRERAAAMHRAKLHRAYDEETIRAFADDYATRCAQLPSLEACTRFAGRFGVKPPEGRGITEEGARARMVDAQWWRRQLRRVWTRAAEECWRDLGEIRKFRQPCASDMATRMVIQRGERMREWARQQELHCDTGEVLEMEQVVRASVAMPANRRTEMMVRIRGCGELAIERGWRGQMFTLTCPSAFHPRLAKSGDENPRYQGFTVRDGQDWLCRMWARARAKLARLSVMYMGVRTAEPHHDGTPHWHGVVWMPVQHLDTFRRVLRDFWLSEYGDEPGAREHRCDFKEADPAKGGEMGLVGYAAKYVAKNIDGHGSIGAEADDEAGGGLSVNETTARKVAWNRIHGIRQFQLIGTAPVGLYRELRRVRDPLPGSALEPARLAADGAQWALFVRHLGGIERAKRRTSSTAHKYSREVRGPMVPTYRPAKRQPKHGRWTRLARAMRPARPDEMPALWIERKPAENPHEHHAGWQAMNGYGEPAAPRVCGVVGFGALGRYASVTTRAHRWRIERKCSNLGNSGGGSGGAWAGLPAATEHGRCGSGNSKSFGGATADSSPRSGVFSDLGPVAITVRTGLGLKSQSLPVETEAGPDSSRAAGADIEAREVARAKRAMADETAGPAPPAPPRQSFIPESVKREARAILERARDGRGRLQ